MTELDLELPGLATELIEEYGKAITFGVVATGTYDPATGENTTGAGGGLTLKAIVEPDKGQAVRAGLVEGADFKLTIAKGDFTPTTEDIVTIDGVAYTVVLVKPTYSGELIALYEIWVRS